MALLTGMRVQSKLGVIDGTKERAVLLEGLGSDSVGVCRSIVALLLAIVGGVARFAFGASMLWSGTLDTGSGPADADCPRARAAVPK